MEDAKSKGRKRGGFKFGVRNTKAKLTDEQIRTIYRRRKARENSIRMAKEYGVCQQYIREIGCGLVRKEALKEFLNAP